MNISKPLDSLESLCDLLVRHEPESVRLHGAFSDVFKGEWYSKTLVKTFVAVKVIRVCAGDQNKIANSLIKEARIWETLNHPNVLPFFGLSYDAERRPALISPWMENGNVLEYMRRNPDTSRIQLISGIAFGMAYLHSVPIVHGDLRGSNILVDSYGKACISDFGLSSIQESMSDVEPLDMAQGSVRWRWMAPELLHDGTLQVNLKTDVYSFASVCYEIFTQRPPFYDISSEVDVILTLYNHGHPRRPPLTHPATSRGLDDRMWALMLECWNISADQRPDAYTLCRLLADEHRQGNPPSRL